MGARGGARLGLALVASALCIVAVAFWLMRDSAATDAARDAADAAPRTERELAAPSIALPDPSRVLPEALTAAAPAAEPAATPDTSAAAAAAPPGLEARFSGRVVDERGAPIGDALVTHVPTQKQRHSMGITTDGITGAFAWETLATTRTAADGTFLLASRDEPATAGKEVRSANRATFTPGSHPLLVVSHPDYSSRTQLCRGFQGGALDVGTVVMEPGGTLIGRVVDEHGVPAPGARVAVARDSPMPGGAAQGDFLIVRQLLSGVSGDDGRFALHGAPAVNLELDVLHADFVPALVMASTRPGSVTDVGDVKLVRGDSIRGLVVDDAGVPIADAEVLARASKLQFGDGGDNVLSEMQTTIRARGVHEVRTRTDAHGAFEVRTLEKPHYTLFAAAPGREPAAEREVPVGSTDRVLRLQPQATLLLTVVDPASKAPIAGAAGWALRHTAHSANNRQTFVQLEVLRAAEAVTAAQGLAGAAQAGALSASDGTGMLLVLRAGRERTEIMLSAPGHATRSFMLPGVNAGELAAHTLELPRESVIAGHVLADGTRTPIAGAALSLAPPEGLFDRIKFPTATTDADGAFRIGELDAGAWRLTVTAPGYLNPDELVCDVGAEQVRDDLQLLLCRGAQLTVRLLGTDGAPAAGEEIVVRRVDTTRNASPWKALTDTQGLALFDALPSEEMTVHAYPGAEAQVTLSAEQPAELTLALRRRPVLRGRVTAASQPVDGARVVALEHALLPQLGGFFTDDRTAVASALGEYELLFDMPMRIAVVARGPGTEGSSTPPVSLVLDWGDERRVDFAFGGARVSGVVLDAATREPLAGVALRLWPLELEADPVLGPLLVQDLGSAATSGANGRFTFERVTAGACRLTARLKGYTLLTQSAVQAVEGETLELPPLELSQGTVVKGRVRTATGKALPAGLRVSLREQPDAAAKAEAAVAADGTWAITGSPLSPGAWTVCVERVKTALFAPEESGAPLLSLPIALVSGENKLADLVIDA